MRTFSILQIDPDFELAMFYLFMAFGSILRPDSTTILRVYNLFLPILDIPYDTFALWLAAFWFLVFILSAFLSLAYGQPRQYPSIVALPLVIYGALLAAITAQNVMGSLTGTLIIIFFLYFLIKSFALQRERETMLELLKKYSDKYGTIPSALEETHE